jgi:alpha,alpha-trehalase
MPDGAVLQRYYDDRDVPRDESYRYDVETAVAAGRPPAVVYRDLRAGAESGWDFSSRWFARGGDLASIETTNVVPVDLNALLFGLEQAIAAGCDRAGEDACASAFTELADARRAAMERYLWSEAGYYADWSLGEARVRERPTAAMIYPLFTGAASMERGAMTLDTLARVLLSPGGVVPTPNESGEQWDAPNGWAPHQWLAIGAADAYGRPDLADEIAERWVGTVARGFCESGKLVEKYDVVNRREGGGGEYPNQDGFGWTNGVTARLIATEPQLKAYGLVTVAADPADCAALAAN